jgi:predicted nucleic acid-binding protein
LEKICLDYEAALDFLRGELATLKKIKWYADREDLCMNTFTMTHLMETVNKPEVINAFVNSVTVLPFDKKAADVFHRILIEARDRGSDLKTVDHLVTAAICMANDAFLFTRSPKNYDGIKGLRKV